MPAATPPSSSSTKATYIGIVVRFDASHHSRMRSRSPSAARTANRANIETPCAARNPATPTRWIRTQNLYMTAGYGLMFGPAAGVVAAGRAR